MVVSLRSMLELSQELFRRPRWSPVVLGAATHTFYVTYVLHSVVATSSSTWQGKCHWDRTGVLKLLILDRYLGAMIVGVAFKGMSGDFAGAFARVVWRDCASLRKACMPQLLLPSAV